MDIKFSAEDLAFRDEVREFFATEFDADTAAKLSGSQGSDYKPAIVAWQKKLHAKGWIAPGWPVEYGGTDWSATQKFIYETERGLAGIPDVVPFGLKMVAPVIYTFGTEDQKAKFLPRILESEDWWCQGYSEPGAGSDLAALNTTAEYAGDDYIVNGRKIWTTFAQYADWIFCLVRTDFEATKHNGISFLLIDMKSAGVSTRPIKLISGKSPFCETFFDGVKVPKENLIGTLNDGWTIAKYLLTHERQMIGGVGETDVRKAVHEIALENMPSRDGILSDSILRSEIAEIEMNDAVFEMTIQRITDEAKTGVNAGALSSFFKYYGTEQNVARMELISSITGTNGLLWESDNKDSVSVVRTFCRSKGNTIEGGTSEVQLGIISKRILNLPS